MVIRKYLNKGGAARPGLMSTALPSKLTPMALAIITALSTSQVEADAQAPFQSMVALQAGMVRLSNGTMSQWSGAERPVIGTAEDGRGLMTIRQTSQKALLDWEKFELQADEILEFQQQRADWIAVNRVHSDSASRIDGEIRAPGRVFILNDNGVLMGENARIETRQLVTGQGVDDVTVEGATTTIVQSQERAVLNWSDMSSQAGEVLKFEQAKKDWIALNRSITNDVTQLDGRIEADGHVMVISPSGLVVNGDIEAQQVVASSLDIRDSQFLGDHGLISWAEDRSRGRMDPTFSNSWLYVGEGAQGADAYFNMLQAGPEATDPDDPLRYGVTIGREATIRTRQQGKVMLFGPNVTNQGTISVVDEGQVILAAGDNIYLASDTDDKLSVYVGAYNPLNFRRANIRALNRPQWTYDGVVTEEWVDFIEAISGVRYEVGYVMTPQERNPLFMDGEIDGQFVFGGYIGSYLDLLQQQRVDEVGFHARNEGIIEAIQGGSVDFRGHNLEQMGAVTVTSTASFRGSISFTPQVQDHQEYAVRGTHGPSIPGQGNVIFGTGSLTQITPDLEATDTLPLSEGNQSVGSLTINAGRVHLQENSLIYLPSGDVKVVLDAGEHVLSNRGAGANTDNEDGTRFLMEDGAMIDLSGWETTLGMGYHQVSGRLFAAQLRDVPMQRGGALYRKEIFVDRRFGTNVADWESFDNLNQGTLPQFLIDGGRLQVDAGDDFIMKSGSVIDVSGGKITYEDGYVYTTLLRRLDGSVIDIREANPDELYMGLANEWVQYDPKWGRQNTYYIPLMSSVRGGFETSYEHGGNGGEISILAPDAVFQGTLRGETVAGRYQASNLPQGGRFTLGDGGETEREYISNNVLIAATEQILSGDFGLYDQLSDIYGNFFGEEFEHGIDRPASQGARGDNATLLSADFFQRSSMGSYDITQAGRPDGTDRGVAVLDGFSVGVEEGADITLANGGSLTLAAGGAMQFLGSVRTLGGDVSLSAEGLVLGEATRIDTRGGWYNDHELDGPVAVSQEPRIHGGDITLRSYNTGFDQLADHLTFRIPETVVLDSSGGGWLDRAGELKAGRGGDLSVESLMRDSDIVDLAGLANARAYGIGGNGAFDFSSIGAVYISDTPVEPASDVFVAQYFDPSFFEERGFSAIRLASGGGVLLADGVEVNASSATMHLRPADLSDAVPDAWTAPSGTDIYALTGIGYLPPEFRPAALRDGMEITLQGTAQLGAAGFSGVVKIGEGSVLRTEPGGTLNIAGAADIRGTLLAPAGTIGLSASASDGVVHVRDTARLLAPGAVRVLERAQDANGRPLIDGEVLSGGLINLGAEALIIDEGAVLDVSGASAVFDVARRETNGAVIRQPHRVSSDGGEIKITGSALDVDGAVYRADAGGEGARGGTFTFEWKGSSYGTSSNGQSPESVVNRMASTYFYLKNGGTVRGLFGVDLSTVDFARANIDIELPSGSYLDSPEELTALLNEFNAAALGTPPVLVIGNGVDLESSEVVVPTIDATTRRLVEQYGFVVPDISPVVAVTALSPDSLAGGGFSEVSINSALGIIFSGASSLGGRTADGHFVYDRVHINARNLMATDDADVHIEGNVVTLSPLGVSNGLLTVDEALYHQALADMGVADIHQGARLVVDAGDLLQVESAELKGFADTVLTSQGDIRLVGSEKPVDGPITGSIQTAGDLTFKADQLYAASAREYTVRAGGTLRVLAQEQGTPVNASPYEAGASLTLTAPRIVQGGTIRSPLGSINLIAFDDGSENANTVQLLPGSLTSVSAEGKIIPYGTTSNGDTWIDPVTGDELTGLPERRVHLSGDVLDLQEGAVIDVRGGGELVAFEFVPGIGGSTDWLSGYRDEDYDWVDDGSEIYAIIPGFDAEIAPVGVGQPSQGSKIGTRIYLSGGGGLKAGYYTLLPAHYAQLPGGFRVTANHHHKGYDSMMVGDRVELPDGSSIQAGYQIALGADEPVVDRLPGMTGFLVMSGDALRLRSHYVESAANEFFTSEAYLRKALRTNLPVSDVPRVPVDGGGVVLAAGKDLRMDADFLSAPAEGGRGGFADIVNHRIAVVGAGTDTDQYEGYLVLDSDRLNAFGADSLLLGGLRREGETGLEIGVAAQDIVIDTQGTTLSGPELLFASGGNISVKSGSIIESEGDERTGISSVRLLPHFAALVDDRGTSSTDDDVTLHDAFDQGSFLRIATSDQIDVIRDSEAVDALVRLFKDPVRLEEVNALRVAAGLDPIVAGGTLTIENGVQLTGSGSVLFDATVDTRLAADATIDTQQISASASRVSIGAVPLDVAGLVFAGESANALTSAQQLVLKSYSSIDFYGSVDLNADGDMTLDGRQIRLLDEQGAGAGAGENVSVSGNTITLANSNGGQATHEQGEGNLLVRAETIYLAGGDKWLSGADDVTLDAQSRIIGRDDGTLNVAGALDLRTGELTAESGARLFIDATGAVRLGGDGYVRPERFRTLGATIGITGETVTHSGRIGLIGGGVTLRARAGDVNLTEGAEIDVTSDIVQIFDVAVGVSAGQVSLVSDRQDVIVGENAVINVSGVAGGDAGRLTLTAGLGDVLLAGNILGDADDGARSGAISVQSDNMVDFAALNAKITEGGFLQSRRFEANQGDFVVTGLVEAQELAMIANDGAINVEGMLRTPGEDGGRIQLAATRGVSLGAGSELLARANTSDGSGGVVLLETAGVDNSVIDMAAGSLIDVTGVGEGGQTVRFRAPQTGAEVAIGSLDGEIVGAGSVIAEAYRVYDDVAVIDEALIDVVSADAVAFMVNAEAIQARLGDQAHLAPGIELRSDGDMELVTDWDLHGLRFGADQSAGVLTLRARGDLLINANLSDGFDSAAPEAALLNGDSWMLNLAAGANTTSPNSVAVLPVGQLEEGKGSVVVGGTPDTLEYFRTPAEPPAPEAPVLSFGWLETQWLNGEITFDEYIAAYYEISAAAEADWLQFLDGQMTVDEFNAAWEHMLVSPIVVPIAPHYGAENRLYLVDENGRFLRDESASSYHTGFLELERDPTTGKYIDPRTGALISQNPDTGDYVDTEYYARRPLPWIVHTQGGATGIESQEGEVVSAPNIYLGSTWEDYKPLQQWNNATGYVVRTGSGAISVSAGRDLILQERPSVIYTAGQTADAVASFHAPAGAHYSENGGDIVIRVAGDILASPDTPQIPTGWLARQGTLDTSSGYYRPGTDRLVNQTTWYADFEHYQAGIGALGGGNVDIIAGGDVRNLSVSIPTTGRMAGNTGPDDPFVLHTTGGGNLVLRAGGNVHGGVYFIQDGRAEIAAGGSILAGSTVESLEADSNRGIHIPGCINWTDCYIHTDMTDALPGYDVHTMVFTSTGNVRITSGGDLNLEAIMDPMLLPPNELLESWEQFTQFQSFTEETQVDLFSAGGDVRVWNNGHNIGLVRDQSRPVRFDYWTNDEDWINVADADFGYELWPATISMTAASGNVEVLGGMIMAPAASGNLELLAGRDVRIGYYTRMEDAAPKNSFDYRWHDRARADNYRGSWSGIYMSQAKPEFLRTTVNMTNDFSGLISEAPYLSAGADGARSGNNRLFNEEALPDLHAGDPHPVRIYAAAGDVITTAPLDLPKAVRVQAGGQIYFPDYRIQHNNSNDLSLIRAGEGIYFSETGEVAVAGPGRLDIEGGRDVWIPSNAKGITSRRITFTDENLYDELPPVVWRPEEQAADIAISVGYNREPAYEAFEQAYFDPAFADGMQDYLLTDTSDGERLPSYLFDHFYARGNGSSAVPVSPELLDGFVNHMRVLQGLEPLATSAEQRVYLDQAWAYWLTLPADMTTAFDGLVPRMTPQEALAAGARPEFYLPERREGLVNHVRRLQGLAPLVFLEEQQAYVDEAWAYWRGLAIDDRTPFYRNVLFLELRTSGREANDPDSVRDGSTARGYEALATLFPGAQRRADEALAEGESRWQGDFETFASRVISSGGGKIEILAPGGAVRLASTAATEEQTGQPHAGNTRGDALRAGLVTQSGGEINIVSHDSVILNQSRILTTQGGNVMLWSSYGDIAAGNGAKTSISPPFYDYVTSPIAHMIRTPAGLPTGAGIGTLAAARGSQTADVDLIAPDGIIDAGDAGLRVSGNFNVFAVQILGTDNIDVSGVSKGLPTPPAAPPTSLDVDDAAAKGARVLGALNDSLEKARDDVKGPSIIEVKVLGYGEECVSDREHCEE